MLCKLVLSKPGILLLDEPTNHLDIGSKETLEAALMDYAGTLVVVSHDRFFLDRVVDRLLVVGVDDRGKKKLGSWELAEGGYTKYARLIVERVAQQELQTASGKTAPKSRKGKKTSQKRVTPEDIRQFNKLSVGQIEEAIMKAEQESEEMLQKFGDEDIYKNGANIAELQAALAAKRTQVELLYKAYEWRMDGA
jgi:ATP-binding cassette subfamily F protein 3